MRSREETPIVSPDERTVKGVLQNIEDYRLGFTILETSDQHIEGIVSNADLRREVLRTVTTGEEIDLENMINRDPITVREDMTVSAMLSFIKEFEFPINYLPVVDENRTVKGVVSFLNLVKGEL